MSVLRILGVVAKWCFKTVVRVAGLIVHGGVDQNGADYLYKPKPPEYRPYPSPANKQEFGRLPGPSWSAEPHTWGAKSQFVFYDHCNPAIDHLVSRGRGALRLPDQGSLLGA